MISRSVAVLLATLITGASSAVARADTLYSNGAPNGTIMGENISGTNLNARADSFTLASNATVTGVTFASWDFPGSAMASVGWAIENSEDTTAPLQTAATSSVFDFTNPNGYRIDEDTFSTGAVNLSAGVYYFVLGDARETDGSGGSWDENDGPSAAFTGFHSPVGSSSFQVLGTSAVSAAPEPAAWALMFAGLAGAGLAFRQAKRKPDLRLKNALAV